MAQCQENRGSRQTPLNSPGLAVLMSCLFARLLCSSLHFRIPADCEDDRGEAETLYLRFCSLGREKSSMTSTRGQSLLMHPLSALCANSGINCVPYKARVDRRRSLVDKLVDDGAVDELKETLSHAEQLVGELQSRRKGIAARISGEASSRIDAYERDIGESINLLNFHLVVMLLSEFSAAQVPTLELVSLTSPIFG
ncbi:hypothetical protein R1sor_017091 [Riccia sorocarpa]|uniref:Uncharacterized protein n=1 Tax=Riccia sorocarpa TaxID=122646 RepID=A0ABD3I7N2_9MARC